MQTGRTDALFLYEDEEPTLLAMNKLEQHTRRVTGRFSIPLEEIEVSYILGKTEDGKPVFDILCTVEEATVRLVLEEKDDSAVFTADYDDFDSAVSVQAVVTEGNETLVVPEGQPIVLKTEEEIQAAAERIAEDLYKAELFGHVWKESTCTEPKTCTICGATEGEPLGHTWKDATCTEPKTCIVCGATEGEALGHTEVWGEPTIDVINGTKANISTCSVCGKTVSVSGEPLQSFVEDGVFIFTPEEFVTRMQNAWNAQYQDKLELTFEYYVFSKDLIGFEIANQNGLYLGGGIFYDRNDNALSTASAGEPVGSIRLFVIPSEDANEDACYYLFTLLSGVCSVAVDPKIEDCDQYIGDITDNAYEKDPLNGLNYICWHDDEGGYFVLDVEIPR